MTKYAFAPAVLVAALAGCTTMTSGMERLGALPTALCNAKNHHCVPVNVSDGQILASDQFIDSANHLVYWTIFTPGYSFPSDGITFVATSSTPLPPANEFTCGPALQGQIFFCIDRNSSSGSGTDKKYKYKIKLTGSPAATDLSDPWIVNH